MSHAKLIRLGALAAMTGGALRVVSSFLPFVEKSVALEAFYLVIDLAFLFGVIALYAFQAAESGRGGFAGFLLATTGVSLIIGPDGGTLGPLNVYGTGAFLFSIGMCLFAFSAPKLPPWTGLLFTASLVTGALGFQLRSFPALWMLSGVLFGAAFIGAGWTVWRATDRAR